MKRYLVEEFCEQIIGYEGFIEWPLCSPDLISTDIFPVGITKTAGVCDFSPSLTTEHNEASDVVLRMLVTTCKAL